MTKFAIDKKRKKVGLALGGGTMRGMTHIGVLEVFEENKIPIDILVGCSSGAIVAAAYACGKMKEFKDIALSMKNKKDRKRLLDFCLTGEGILKGRKMESFFEYITGGKDFEDLKDIKLAFVATDVLTNEEIILNNGDIAKALLMTTALPGLTPLRRYRGRLIMDGGTVSLVPADVAYKLGADVVIGVDVSVNRNVITRTVGDVRKAMRNSRVGRMASPVFRMQEKIKNADERKFLGRAKKLMKKIKLLDDYENHRFNFLEMYLIGLRATSWDYKRGLFRDEDCDIAIRPDVMHVKRADVTKTAELIKEGRKAATRALPRIEVIVER